MQLPWPSAASHRINGGNTYGCDTHSSTLDRYAIDFQFSINETVSAVASGTVTFASYNNGWGNQATVDHGGGYASIYSHLNGFAVSQGSSVAQGATIGYAGSTGATAVHLHFALRLDGASVRPERMSNIPALGERGFGWYGHSLESGLGCSSYGHDPSPDWIALTPTWHGWIDWGAYADKSPIAVSYSDDRLDHTHLAARTGSDIFVRSWTGSTWQA